MDAIPVLFHEVQQKLSDQKVRILTISNLKPNELAKNYQFESDDTIWLSKKKKKNAISPSNLSKLANMITQFIEQNEKSIILIDGIKSILSKNKPDDVVKFIKDLDKATNEKKSVIVIISKPETFTQEDNELLEQAAKKINNNDFKSLASLV